MNGSKHDTMITFGGWCLVLFSILFIGLTLLIDGMAQKQVMLYSMENHNLFKVAAGSEMLRLVLTSYALVPLLLIPGAVAAFYAFIDRHEANMRVGMYFATAGAFALCLGLLLLPSLNWYLVGHIGKMTTPDQISAITFLQGLHSYFGVFVGDLLGFGCLLVWFFITSLVMFRSPVVPHAVGIILLILAITAALVLAFRYTGLVPDTHINVQAPGIFALWTFICGITLISLRKNDRDVTIDRDREQRFRNREM